MQPRHEAAGLIRGGGVGGGVGWRGWGGKAGGEHGSCILLREWHERSGSESDREWDNCEGHEEDVLVMSEHRASMLMWREAA